MIVELARTSVADELSVLKIARNSLSADRYNQRKEHLLFRLAKFIPGGAPKLSHTTHPLDPELDTDDPDLMAKSITDYWQNVMNEKATSSTDRGAWLRNPLFAHANRFATPLETLIPPIETVKGVIDNAPTSSPGPDGIPFSAYKAISALAAPVLWGGLQDLFRDPSISLPRDFNECFPVSYTHLTLPTKRIV